MAHIHHSVIDIAHRLADHDLVLSAGAHDFHDAVRVLQDFRVGFALVLQGKTQAGNAVGKADNVVFSSDIGQDDPGQTIVFVHSFLLLVMSGRTAAFVKASICRRLWNRARLFL